MSYRLGRRAPTLRLPITNYQGKHGYLSKSEKAEIILWLSQKEVWDLAELAIYIESKYGVIYQYTFRSFRDEKLLPHPLGKKLVTLYYKISPTIAQYIEKQPTIKQTLKHHLARLANCIRRKKITSR